MVTSGAPPVSIIFGLCFNVLWTDVPRPLRRGGCSPLSRYKYLSLFKCMVLSFREGWKSRGNLLCKSIFRHDIDGRLLNREMGIKPYCRKKSLSLGSQGIMHQPRCFVPVLSALPATGTREMPHVLHLSHAFEREGGSRKQNHTSNLLSSIPPASLSFWPFCFEGQQWVRGLATPPPAQRQG